MDEITIWLKGIAGTWVAVLVSCTILFLGFFSFGFGHNIGHSVGWVERSETQQLIGVGFRSSTQPTGTFRGQGMTDRGVITVNPDIDLKGFPIDRKISWSFTLENKTPKPVRNAEFWTWGPVRQTAHQQCRKIISSHPYMLVADDAGNQILSFQFDRIPPYGSKIVAISATLGLSDLPHPAVPGLDNALYLKPETFIESGHALIRKAAVPLKQSEELSTIRATYEWASKKIKYGGYTSRDRGALSALGQGTGDCTEFMYLFIALCRANGIPARGIGGYVCRQNTVLKPANFHNWAEVLHDNRWRMADPQGKRLFDPGSFYIALHIMGEYVSSPLGHFHRFGFKGEGLVVRMD
nr:transglutaminase-like domain-containing protein [uncultured Desulfobacter sp.]